VKPFLRHRLLGPLILALALPVAEVEANLHSLWLPNQVGAAPMALASECSSHTTIIHRQFVKSTDD
jgi:hypothetical protein